MAASIGKLEAFNPAVDAWDFWYKRFAHFAKTNKIQADCQASALITLIGGTNFQLLETLASPNNVNDLSVNEIAQILMQHFEPASPVIMESFRFYKRCQAENETVAQYLAALRQLATRCDFGTALERNLRDRLVCGLRHEGIQRRLLSEKNLNLAKALETAQSIELAEKNTKEMQAISSAAFNSHSIGKVSFNNRQPGQRKQQQQRRNNFQSSPSTQQRPSCFRCGSSSHPSKDCRHKTSTCAFCRKVGHLESICQSKLRSQSSNAAAANSDGPRKQQRFHGPKRKQHTKLHHVSDDADDSNDGNHFDAHDVLTISANHVAESSPPIRIPALVNGHSVTFEYDTGAGVALIPEQIWRNVLKEPPLEPFPVTLKVYGGKELPALGQFNACVNANKHSATLPLVVVQGPGTCLLGRNWMEPLGFPVAQVSVQQLQLPSTPLAAPTAVPAPPAAPTAVPPANPRLAKILQKYPDVFKDELETCKGVEATLLVKPGATPRFFKPRPVPLALRPKVEADLQRLQRLGVIKPVPFAKWAAPLVVVPKPNGSVRLCGDFKVTINSFLDVNQYPLPRIEELLATLNGGESFSKIDLSDAYLQLKLAEESKQYLCINTHMGLFEYQRMAFGIAPAAAIFQHTIEMVLQGLPGVAKFQDDIAVTGRTTAEHLSNLEAVLRRLSEYGLRVKLAKCEFVKPSICYLGFIVDKHGVHTSPAKVEAVLNIPPPENQQQVRVFLGMVVYYSKFLPQLADIAAPLNRLTRDDVPWQWSTVEQQAFLAIKQALSAAPTLAHYDESLPLGLACDASSIGLGAVLYHTFPDGTEKPVGYASKTLTATQSRYSQIDKEALAIIFAVRKFNQYIYGRKFTLVTDHKPLLALFGASKGIPSIANNRLQRWAVILSAYTYDLQFRPTASHGNVDTLSRFPVGPDPHFEAVESLETIILQIAANQLDQLPVDAKRIRDATAIDPVLQKLICYATSSWPKSSKQLLPALQPYFLHRNEISLFNDCAMWGNRVIIPAALHQAVLQELHTNHCGVVRMKSAARQIVWWPQLDKSIEQFCASCDVCQLCSHNPPKAPVQQWPAPAGPWLRLHADFAGPYWGRMWLVVVDTYSRFPEIVPMTTITSESTIKALMSIFARFGLPKTLVTDNGPSYSSDEFAAFCTSRGIKHIFTPPYFPASNGSAERYVQSFKDTMDKAQLEHHDWFQYLQNYLLRYRACVHPATGKTPAQLLMGRELRTRLSLMHPAELSAKPKPTSVSSNRIRTFGINDQVWIRNHVVGKAKWMPAVVAQQFSPVSYNVRIANGSLVKRHIDQMRQRVNRKPIVSDKPAAVVSPAPVQQRAVAKAPVQLKQYPLRSRVKQILFLSILLICSAFASDPVATTTTTTTASTPELITGILPSANDAAIRKQAEQLAEEVLANRPDQLSRDYEFLAQIRAELETAVSPERRRALILAYNYISGTATDEPPEEPPAAQPSSTTTPEQASASVYSDNCNSTMLVLPGNSSFFSWINNSCRPVFYISISIIALLVLLIFLVVWQFRLSSCMHSCQFCDVNVSFSIRRNSVLHHHHRTPAVQTEAADPVTFPLVRIRY